MSSSSWNYRLWSSLCDSHTVIFVLCWKHLWILLPDILVPQYPQHFHSLGSSFFYAIGKSAEMTTVKKPVTVQRNCQISNCTVNLHWRHKHHLILLKGNSYYDPFLVLAVNGSPDRFHPTTPLSISELLPFPWSFSSCDHQGIHIFKEDNNF